MKNVKELLQELENLLDGAITIQNNQKVSIEHNDAGALEAIPDIINNLNKEIQIRQEAIQAAMSDIKTLQHSCNIKLEMLQNVVKENIEVLKKQ